ncbi:MAG TPA: hypothetical protein ENN18_04890 [Proteobacteria bacterium]|nr:hypothetical protein [Pseudomonadota bacterium]
MDLQEREAADTAAALRQECFTKGDYMKSWMPGLVCIIVLLYPQLVRGDQETLAAKKDYPWKGIKLGPAILDISGTYRLRGEMQDETNIRTYGTGTKEDYILSRLRLDLDLQLPHAIRLHTQIQDAEAMGLSFSDKDFSPGNNPYHDPFDINQAYVEYRPVKEATLKVGRQSISFGDRRVFGPGNWGNTGRYAWDAARFRYNNDYIDSNWLTGRYIIHDPDRWPNKSADGPTAYATYNTIKKLPFILDVFYVLKEDDRGSTVGERGRGNLSSHSIGFRVDGKQGAWDYGSTVVDQFGKWGGDDIRAYGLEFHLGYTLDAAWEPHLILQYVAGSGDDDPTDGIHVTFDGVFGGADTVLYGWMNLFFWKNLREHRMDLLLTPEKDLTLRAEYHYFTLDKPRDAWYYPGNAQRRDNTGSSGRELGHEVDLTARKKVADYLEVLGGYCFFIPGEFIKNTGSSPTAYWYFLEATLYF